MKRIIMVINYFYKNNRFVREKMSIHVWACGKFIKNKFKTSAHPKFQTLDELSFPNLFIFSLLDFIAKS